VDDENRLFAPRRGGLFEFIGPTPEVGFSCGRRRRTFGSVEGGSFVNRTTIIFPLHIRCLDNRPSRTPVAVMGRGPQEEPPRRRIPVRSPFVHGLSRRSLLRTGWSSRVSAFEGRVPAWTFGLVNNPHERDGAESRKSSLRRSAFEAGLFFELVPRRYSGGEKTSAVGPPAQRPSKLIRSPGGPRQTSCDSAEISPGRRVSGPGQQKRKGPKRQGTREIMQGNWRISSGSRYRGGLQGLTDQLVPSMIKEQDERQSCGVVMLSRTDSGIFLSIRTAKFRGRASCTGD